MKILLSLLAILSILFFFNNSKEHSCIENSSEVTATKLSCPKMGKKAFLNRLYPAKSIIIGHTQEFMKHQTLYDLVTLLPKSLKKIIITTNSAHSILKEKLKNTPNTSLYPYDGKEFTWIQDYFKPITDSMGNKKIFNIPHLDESAQNMTINFAKQCKLETLNDFSNMTFTKIGSGDFAGNIYPLSNELILIGDNMSKEIRELIKSHSDQHQIILETSWFETGHVDEIISIFPLNSKKDGSNCSFALGVASPLLAMNLIDIDRRQRLELSNFIPFFNETTWEFAKCMHHLIQTKNSSFGDNECKSFKEFNLSVEKIMNRNLEIINLEVKKMYSCDIEKIIKLPVLLAPIDISEDNELRGLYRFINSNPLNNILIQNQVFIADQFYDPFGQYINNIMNSLNLEVKFIDGILLHDMGGGPHCNSIVVRDCR